MSDMEKKKALSDDMLDGVTGGVVTPKRSVNSVDSGASEVCPVCGLPRKGIGKNICSCKTAII